MLVTGEVKTETSTNVDFAELILVSLPGTV